MNLQQLILREYLCRYVIDPAKPCIALRAQKAPPYLSIYAQMVQYHNDHKFLATDVHMIASPDLVDRVIFKYFNLHNIVLHEIGETYCVEPYTIGFTHVGQEEKEEHAARSASLSDPFVFKKYMAQFAKTEDGWLEALECHKRHRQLGNGDIESLLNTSDDVSKKKIISWYLAHYAHNTEKFDFAKYQETRIVEFKEAILPVTGNARVRTIPGFRDDMTICPEHQAVIKSAKDYGEARWLYKKLTA